MPLMRYFFFVGGVLLALLVALDAYLPKLPIAESAAADLPVIRIHSDRKWPERVVFDTNHPTIVAAQAANPPATDIVAGVRAPATIAEVSANPRVRAAFAQLQPVDARQPQPSDLKRPEPQPQRKRKIATRRAAPPMLLAQQPQQPQFGWFGNNTW
jgi:hypothetical protein